MLIKGCSFNEAKEHWYHGDKHVLYKWNEARDQVVELAYVLSCFSFAWAFAKSSTNMWHVILFYINCPFRAWNHHKDEILEIVQNEVDGGQWDGQIWSGRACWDHPIRSLPVLLAPHIDSIERCLSSLGHRSTSRIGPRTDSIERCLSSSCHRSTSWIGPRIDSIEKCFLELRAIDPQAELVLVQTIL